MALLSDDVLHDYTIMVSQYFDALYGECTEVISMAGKTD